MKHYVYILSLLILLLAVSGCRSNRNLQSTSKQTIETAIKEQSTTTEDSSSITRKEVDTTIEISSQQDSQTDVTSSEDKQTDEYEKTKAVKEEFDEDGKLKSRTTTETERGRTESTASGTRASNASSGSTSSVGATKEKEEAETKTNIEMETVLEIKMADHYNEDTLDIKNTDSRWIQGVEWLYVILPIALIIGIIYLIRNGRKKSNTDSSH